MLAFQIIGHSIGLLRRNWCQLMTIIALPALLLAISNSLRMRFIAAQFTQAPASAPIGGGWLALSILMALAGLIWAAVAWHRFILLNERPTLLPRIRLDRMLAYLGHSLLIALVLIGIVLPPVFLMVAAGGISLGMVQIATFILSLLIAVIGLRLGAGLPGVAVGTANALAHAWRATRGKVQVFVLLAMIGIAARMLLNAAATRVFLVLPGDQPLAFAVVATGLDGLAAMVSLSVLTTLQGHFVQGRPLG